MNCFSTWLGKSLDMKPWLLGVGAGMAARGRWETEPSPCSRSSFALGAAWLWNFQWHTLSVVQDFKSPSFWLQDFEAIWLHFLILQMRKWGPEVWNQFPYSSPSWLGTEESANLSYTAFWPFLRLGSCWNLRCQVFLPAPFQLGKLPVFKSQIYFYMAHCVYWTVGHHI